MMDEDWGAFESMVESVDDKIENTIIWFPTPLPLKVMMKNDPRFLYHLLVRLHDMGVSYDSFGGGEYYSMGKDMYRKERKRPLLKMKLQNKFGKMTKIPSIYSHIDFSEENLYYIRVDGDCHLFYGTEEPNTDFKSRKEKEGYKNVDVFDLF